MTKVLDVVEPGVVTGDDLQKLLQVAKDEDFALPAVNVVGSDSVNAVLEEVGARESAIALASSCDLTRSRYPDTASAKNSASECSVANSVGV